MEAYELRRLRIAHGLMPNELARLVGVAAEDVYAWEAPPSSPHAAPITPDARRVILRELTLWRDARHRTDPPLTPAFVARLQLAAAYS